MALPSQMVIGFAYKNICWLERGSLTFTDHESLAELTPIPCICTPSNCISKIYQYLAVMFVVNQKLRLVASSFSMNIQVQSRPLEHVWR